eukprot:745888-Amphidinium_carterae.1
MQDLFPSTDPGRSDVMNETWTCSSDVDWQAGPSGFETTAQSSPRPILAPHIHHHAARRPPRKAEENGKQPFAAGP